MLRLLLCNELKSAIHLRDDLETEIHSPRSSVIPVSEQSIQVKNVPLKRVEDTTQIAYVSAIALQQAVYEKITPMQLATQLVGNLRQAKSKTQAISSFADISLESFSIRVIPPGFIWFELSDRGIAAVFQQVLHQPEQSCQLIHPPPLRNQATTTLATSLPDPAGKVVFLMQYAHARCCSLLRLAQEQEIIELALESIASGKRRFLQPDPVPWLDRRDDRLLALRLQHPTERLLIRQVFWILDELSLPIAGNLSDSSNQFSPKQLRHFDRLIQAFQAFYQECRIFSLDKENIPLAQARLGLLQVVQWLLQFTLEERLGTVAPIEL
jgi:arginyl-tRNA synthetase